MTPFACARDYSPAPPRPLFVRRSACPRRRTDDSLSASGFRHATTRDRGTDPRGSCAGETRRGPLSPSPGPFGKNLVRQASKEKDGLSKVPGITWELGGEMRGRLRLWPRPYPGDQVHLTANGSVDFAVADRVALRLLEPRWDDRRFSSLALTLSNRWRPPHARRTLAHLAWAGDTI